jgi:hypothetical protein
MSKMTSPKRQTLVAFPLEAYPFTFDESPITEEQAGTLIRLGLRHRVYRRVKKSPQLPAPEQSS